jgi:hypothetical protein
MAMQSGDAEIPFASSSDDYPSHSGRLSPPPRYHSAPPVELGINEVAGAKNVQSEASDSDIDISIGI